MARFPNNEIISLTGATATYDLAESVGPDLGLGDLLDVASGSDLAEMPLGYGTAAGDPGLRKVIAEQHGVAAQDVIVTVGGMHALFLIAFTVCEPGDEAVTTSPQFPLARNALEAVRAKVRTVQLSFDRGYRLDPDDLRQQLSARTRLVSLASPQNPSGVALAPDVLGDLIERMQHQCPRAFLLLDETYREAAYGEDPVAASALELSPKVISCASLSKCHGAPGLRLGWAITRDADLRDALVNAKFNTVISCSRVDEALALQVLQRSDRIIGERRTRLAEGLAATADWIRDNGELVEWVRPDAGALCCVRLRPAVFDDIAVGRFYDNLANKGARVANGTWFGEEARVFRLGFGLLPLADLQTALRHVSAALTETLREAA